jgi:exopolyphosphatase/guanosine-5'-triphosphate,3'-diphosphate pyrophosphatase
MVYAELMERCHVQSFRYSPLGLRDGLLAQMAAEYDRSTRSGRQIESERWESIQRAMKHYGVDVNHAKDVRTSALQLFDSLKTLHRLPAEYREWLSAAAMLYEVGGYVNRSGRHRHAHYIIANSEILRYTSQQRRIIAAIARYLGKSRPTPGDAPTQGLSPVEQENIRKGSLLLRLARAINLGRSGAVEKIRIQQRGGTVTLKLATRRRIGAELEMWAIDKDRTYFREVFGRELSVAAL